MLVYLHIHVYIVTYVPKHDHMNISLGAHTQECIPCKHSYMQKSYLYSYECTQAETRISIHVHIYSHRQAHTNTHIHTSIYSPPFTHKPILDHASGALEGHRAGSYCEKQQGRRVHQRQSCPQPFIDNKQAVTVASKQVPTTSPVPMVHKDFPFRRIPPPIPHSPASEVFVPLCPSPEHTRPS